MLVAILGGCANVSAPLVGVLSDSFSEVAADSGHKVTTAALRPDFEYLKIQAQDSPAALLVLGYVDHHPLGDIEVWYSAAREVIKLQNGRIVGTAGLPMDWRSVSHPVSPPPWLQIARAADRTARYERLRYVMPGYRTGEIETIEVSVTQPPTGLAASFMAENLIWVQEHVINDSDRSNASMDRLPDAWFAVGSQLGRGQVRASFQCLSNDICYTLQRWPVGPKAP